MKKYVRALAMTSKKRKFTVTLGARSCIIMVDAIKMTIIKKIIIAREREMKETMILFDSPVKTKRFVSNLTVANSTNQMVYPKQMFRKNFSTFVRLKIT